MNTIDELRSLLIGIGIEESVAKGISPDQPLAGNFIDSADYPAFIVAVEERYGVRISDRYALKMKSLDDFGNFVNPVSQARTENP